MAGEPYNEIVYKAGEKIIAGGNGTTTSPNVVVGNVASGAADSGAPVKIAGKLVTGTLTAGSTGQRLDVMSDDYGNLRSAVALRAAGGAVGDGASQNIIGYTYATITNNVGANYLIPANAPWKFNGTSWDRDRKPNVSKRIASSAASGNPDFLKASAGDLTKFWGLNGAAITYVQIYNKASAPTIGTDTPILTFPVAANAAFDVTIPNGGLYFATGIAYAFTTDAAGTTGAAAAAVTSCNIIGA